MYFPTSHVLQISVTCINAWQPLSTGTVQRPLKAVLLLSGSFSQDFLQSAKTETFGEFGACQTVVLFSTVRVRRWFALVTLLMA